LASSSRLAFFTAVQGIGQCPGSTVSFRSNLNLFNSSLFSSSKYNSSPKSEKKENDNDESSILSTSQDSNFMGKNNLRKQSETYGNEIALEI
jgi:hypothetical protein